MIDGTALCQHGSYGLIHIIKIRICLFCMSLRFLQFYGRNKLHGLCNLLCAGNTAFAPLYITHGRHSLSPPFTILHAYLKSFLHASIAVINFCSVSSSNCFVSRMDSKISGYLVSISSNNAFSNARISSTGISSKYFLVAA